MFKTFRSKRGNRYLYDSSSNNIFQVDDDSYKLIGADEGDTEKLCVLGSDFWASIYGDEQITLGPSLEDIGKRIEGETPKVLILELTQQCNFRCDYCIYSGNYRHERTHAQICMDESDIDRIYERYFQGEDTPRYIGFYGGEPLLKFDLIKRLVGRIRNEGLDVKYALTTNGALLCDSDILRFLMDANFSLNISYDGLNHDLYRHSINGKTRACNILEVLRRIKELDVDYLDNNVTLFVTLTPPFRLRENAQHFMVHPLLKGIRLNVSMVNKDDNSFFEPFDMPKEIDGFNNELLTVIDDYIETEGAVPHFYEALLYKALARIDGRPMCLSNPSYPPGQCEIGTDRLFITADGRKFMCERVGQYGQLGTLDDKTICHDCYDAIRRDFDMATQSRCHKCYLVRICDTCMASLREGAGLATDNELEERCENKRAWFDLMFYAFLSRKELGKDI